MNVMRIGKSIVYSVVPVLFMSGLALAQTGRVKDNHVGCLTEESHDQMTHALASQDERLFQTLINKVCFFIQGREFSVLDRGFLTSKIRVYVGDDYVDLWVPSEATQ